RRQGDKEIKRHRDRERRLADLPVSRSPGLLASLSSSAVAAGLPLLQRSGQKLTQENSCITCHQTSLLAMTVGLVRRHGLAVNEELAARARTQVETLLGGKIQRLLLEADLDALLAPYTLVGMAAEDQQPSALTDALVHYVVLRQRTDGSWPSEAYRPPEEGSDFMFTAL